MWTFHRFENYFENYSMTAPCPYKTLKKKKNYLQLVETSSVLQKAHSRVAKAAG